MRAEVESRDMHLLTLPMEERVMSQRSLAAGKGKQTKGFFIGPTTKNATLSTS